MALADLSAAWWAWTASLAVQAAAVVAAVLVLDRILERRGWPQLRMALWLLAALRFIVPPTLTSPLGLGGSTAEGVETASASAFDPTPLLLAWTAGAAIVAAIHVRRSLRIRTASRGDPAPAWMHVAARDAARRIGLARVPPVVVSTRAPTAYVHGPLRSFVVIPAAARPADVRSMLLHEFAHVKRGDLLVDAALSALSTLFWFHPAVWLVRHRVAQLREICCDATVAAALGPGATEYRETLLRAASNLLDRSAPAPAFLGASSQIVARLRSLERGPSRRPRLRAASIVILAAAFGVAALPASPPDTITAGAARGLIASAMDGTSRPGCLRLHFAAMRIAADSR